MVLREHLHPAWLICPALCMLPVVAARAQAPCQAAYLTSIDSVQHGHFGAAISMAENVAIIGATGEAPAGVRSGAAYVYRRTSSGWHVEQSLSPSDGQDGDAFGYAVAVDGDVALVGAATDDDRGVSSGSAYVFRFDGAQWVEMQKLLPPPTSGDYLFGWSVALAGDLAVVGAPVLPYPPEETGFAFVYRFDGATWRLERTLQPGDRGADQQFGVSVATDGQRIVVGARWSDARALNGGAAYVYAAGDNWNQAQQLLASDGRQNDAFGRGVAIDGDTIAIGAPQPWNGRGAVYIFDRNGPNWIERERLAPDSGGSNERFGQALALRAGWLVVGAPQTFTGPGRAYVLARVGDDWLGPQELLPQPPAGPQATYGAAVAVWGDEALVGAANAEGGCQGDTACDLGAVHAFRLAGGCAVPGDTNCDGAVDSFDIEPFTLALFEPDNYWSQYPDCDINTADINRDGFVNSFDIEPFIELLFGP